MIALHHRLMGVSCLLLAACSRPAEPISYRPYNIQDSTLSSFRRGIVTSEDFSDDRLVATFRKFLASRDPKFRVSRLLLAEADEVLLFAGYGPGEGFAFYNPARLNEDWRDREVADVWWFGGAATARIKQNGRTKVIQLQGDRDARMITADGRSATLISFREEQYGGDRLIFSAVANPLPSEVESNHIYEKLGEMLQGGDAFELLMRSDQYFAEFGGPVIDVVDYPFPDISEASYYGRDAISCKAGREGESKGPCSAFRPTKHDLLTEIEQFKKDMEQSRKAAKNRRHSR